MPRKTKKLNTQQHVNRRFILSVSMFLLKQESLKNQFWAVKSVDYNHIEQAIRVGIESTTGKYGTTLVKLRKYAKPLASYLHEAGLTFRVCSVTFFVDKEEMEMKRLYNILEKVENL